MKGLELLTGTALVKCGSITGFCKAMGWSRPTAYKVLNGKRIPTISELVDMSKLLDMDFNDLVDIFFTLCVA